MVTYRVTHPASSTADPLTKSLALCDPGDAMTGMGLLTAGEARASAPGSSQELFEGSACSAEVPDDAASVHEDGLPLCPLIAYVACVDLEPFHGSDVDTGETNTGETDTGDTDTGDTDTGDTDTDDTDDTDTGDTDTGDTDTGDTDTDDTDDTDTPSIRLTPEVGPAGQTTAVEGSGFAPGTQVSLRWDRGVDTRRIPVTVMADGSFSTQLLVMPNDLLGARMLIVDLADDPYAFPDVVAKYLVVPGTGLPPNPDGDGFVIRR